MKILLIYGTAEGQTRKIGAFISDRLASRGHSVLLVDANQAPPALHVEDFDAVLIAAPLHVGRYPASVVDFARSHRLALDSRPNAFISVSLAAASGERGDNEGLKRCVAGFVARTQWAPRHIHHVAGAFRYSAYGFLTRWVMRYIAYRKGAPTDTRRDHELTDWQDLARFADAFVVSLATAASN